LDQGISVFTDIPADSAAVHWPSMMGNSLEPYVCTPP
jgi:hypothetical protein